MDEPAVDGYAEAADVLFQDGDLIGISLCSQYLLGCGARGGRAVEGRTTSGREIGYKGREEEEQTSIGRAIWSRAFSMGK